jgi:hypothetical protein
MTMKSRSVTRVTKRYDGKRCIAQIEKLRDQVREFEKQKTAKARTTKYLLMARG